MLSFMLVAFCKIRVYNVDQFNYSNAFFLLIGEQDVGCVLLIMPAQYNNCTTKDSTAQ